MVFLSVGVFSEDVLSAGTGLTAFTVLLTADFAATVLLATALDVAGLPVLAAADLVEADFVAAVVAAFVAGFLFDALCSWRNSALHCITCLARSATS